MKPWHLTLAALASGQLACYQAILTAPPSSTITLVANPTFIVANSGVSVISALVIEPAGTPVADGTVIQFFTTLGTIEEQGKTNDGVARVNLLAGSRSGTATITAASGPVTATTDVTIGNVLPARVFLTADPPRITRDQVSYLVATIFDVSGNPVANTPVIFAIEGTPATETLGSGGRPQYTDNNGQAFDTLRTTYKKEDPPKTITIKASTANGQDGTTQVTIN
jgi:adhesin/invasin